MTVTKTARDRPVREIEITVEMIEADEAVLDRACDQAEVPTSWFLISAARMFISPWRM
jgi:hypothetical protein